MEQTEPPLFVEVIGVCPPLADTTTRRLSTLPAVAVRSISTDLARSRPRRPDADRPAGVIVIASGSLPLEAQPLIVSVVRAAHPTPVVVISDLDDEDAMLDVLKTGAFGYLMAVAPDDELSAALKRVAHGETIIDPTIAGRIVAQIARGSWRGGSNPTVWHLSPRERQVLDSLIEGRTNRDIAKDLNLSQETVKSHLRSLYRKLGARDRSHAIAITLGRQPRPQAP